MRRILTKAQAIKIALYVILAFAIITIFPLRLWNENIVTGSDRHAAGAIAVGGEATALQQFNAEYDHLESIGIYLEGDYYSDSFTLRVFDKNFGLLREETVSIDKLYNAGAGAYSKSAAAGYADVFINMDTEVGETYYYTVEGLTTEFNIDIEATGNSSAANNGYMQYAGDNRDGFNIVTRYNYEQPLRKLMSLVWIFVLAAIGAVATLIINKLSANKLSAKLGELCTIQWIIRLIGNPLVVIAAVIALIYIIPLHTFSTFVADLIVMGLGVVLFAALLLCVINRDYTYSDFDLISYVSDNWQNLLQSLFIALAIMASINYMNGLYEVHHDIAWRQMVFYLGVSLIVTFSRNELLKIYNLIVLVVSIAAAQVYYMQNIADMEDIYHVDTLRWTCRLFPVVAIMLAYFIRCIVKAIKKELKIRVCEISWPYLVLTLILLVGMIVRRNTRTWPIMMAVAFGVIAVRYLFWERRIYFLNNILNGVIMHFLGTMLYCLWHRPWEAGTYSRYPFAFHTVTETACYMALVLTVVLVKLFYKYNRVRKLKYCMGEMFLFGIVAAYTFFTMSRTGMISIVAAGLILWFAMITSDKTKGASGEAIDKLKKMLAAAGVVIVSVVVCFPIAFTAQKAIPGIVGEPKLMEIERYPESVMVGADLASDEYITFGRFAQVFLYKMIGLPESRMHINRYTIYGYQEEDNFLNIFDDTTSQYFGYGEISSAEKALAPESMTASTTMVATKGVQVFYAPEDDFVPPLEWNLEGVEAPPEFYMREYWKQNPETGEWVYAYWMRHEEAENDDVSNGRMDIYRAYLDQMTMEGHEGMGAILNDGSEAAHAHDIYLQVAYDHGIIIGGLFFLWVAITCIQALIVFMRRRRVDSAAGVVLAVSVTYAVAGVVEWISHPCNPVGCVFLLVVIPMALAGKCKENS